jgi:hypothetical protein
MHPVLMFSAGLLTGIVGIRLAKKAGTSTTAHDLGEKTRHGVDQARDGLRKATVDGLAAVERASASLRGRLESPPAEPTPGADDAKPVEDGAKS